MVLAGWRRVSVICFSLCLAAGSALGQASTNPVLHRRSEPASSNQAVIVSHRHSDSLIPEEASGEYQLDDSGSLIEVTLQFGQLSGYISRAGDQDSDRGAPLTFLFDRTTLNGQRLSFTTRQVHGIWFSFDGTIVRGTARTHAEDGYYLLEGDLVEHNEVVKTQRRASVSLKLNRQLN